MAGYANLDEVRELTTVEEVKELSDIKLKNYIDRAGSWIRRVTKQTFEAETDPDILLDLTTATYLLVEYLWYQDQLDNKDSNLMAATSETIGSYSYTTNKTAVSESKISDDMTGIKELDMILGSLMVASVNNSFFFSVSTPSKGKPGPYEL